MLGRARRIWFALKERVFLARHGSRSERFAAIHRDNVWQNPESRSGFGSTLAATAQLRDGLDRLLRAERVGSILDAPCGDCNWQPHLAFAGAYTGVDIVPDLIAANRARIADPRFRFAVADLVEGGLPQAELVLCRECLNHLPLADGARALDNLAAAATRFLLVTHYPGCTGNGDQPASFRYRPLNLTLAPFGLRPPDRLIREDGFEGGKAVAVWDLAAGPPRAGT